MKTLSVQGLSKVYAEQAQTKAHEAIGDLSLDVGQAEFVSLLGPSGCGKTTLLNVIAGLDTDYEGTVTLAPGVAETLAYVFQTPRLLPWRTVSENIELVLPAGQGKGAVQKVIGDVGLDKFADAYPSQLSLGMQRRAALARAFVLEPQLLLMDEPFVSLDELATRRLRNLLMELWRARPTTVLFVTHDNREAIMLATRIVILSSAPCRVLRQVDVTLNDEERADPAAVEAFRAENGLFLDSE